jgi:hypothetical protein
MRTSEHWAETEKRMMVTNRRRIGMKRIIVALFGTLILAALQFSCNFLGNLSDPADPNSPNYQGFIVVDTEDKVVLMQPKDTFTFPPTLYAAKLLGGIAYRFQISADQSFSKPDADLEQAGNILVPREWVPSLGPGSYYLRVQARKDPTWGAWSPAQAFTLRSLGSVAAPSFSVAEGSYASTQTVTISCSTYEALIRYTTDGTNPSPVTGTLYSAPVEISSSLTLKAVAYKPGYSTSGIASATYTVNGGVIPPSFSPGAGTYTSARSVTISSDTQGASIRYTTDGSDPSQDLGTLYSSPVPVSQSTTLKAIAYKTGWLPSTVSSAEYVITGTVEAPVISPAGGTYVTAQTVSITCVTVGASIRYTLDGSSPSSTEGTLYAGSFTLSSSATIKAIAYKADWENSSIASNTYTITGTIAAPSFSPDAGTYTSPQSVSISTTPSDASIRYTLDGSTPTETTGTLYSGAIQVSSTKTIKAIAYKQGWTTSQVSSGTYTITGTVAAPTFSPAAGTYATSQSVSLSCALEGSSIRYTLDGTNPSATTGLLYSSVIPITSSLTIKAIAYKTDWENSAIASASYIITGSVPAPTFSPGPGTYTTSKSVNITCTLEGTSIRYTMDGSTPTETNGTLYEGTVPVSSSLALKAVAYRAGWTTSQVSSAAYVITGTVPTPTFSPVAGTYTSSRVVTINCSLNGASIRYTTDGTTPTSSTGTLYSSPVMISSTKTIKAVAYKSDWADSDVGSAAYTITGTVPDPTFSVSEGTFNSNQSVALSCSLSGSSIRYTIDGSTPSATAGTLYSSPITIDKTTTLKAIAYKTDWDSSKVVQKVYTMVVPTPTFNPEAGTYASVQNVKISCSLEGSSIRYTTDGIDPTSTYGVQYENALSITSTKTLKAIASREGWTTSSIASSFYTINGMVAAPIFSVSEGVYTNTQLVTIACSIPEASIRYTIDGTNPTKTSGILYSSEIIIKTTTTLKAIAYKDNWLDSEVATAVYNISGTISAWARTVIEGSGSSSFSSTAIDSMGNIYAAGYQRGSGTFTYHNGITVKGTNTDFNSVLVKYNAAGTAQWARTAIEGSGDSDFSGTAVDSSGNIYTVGYQWGKGTYTYGIGISATGSSAEGNAILVKYDSSGTAQWARTVSTGSKSSCFLDVVVDNKGNIYTVGYQTGTELFTYGPDVSATGTNTNSNIILVKYNASGIAQWARSVSSGSNTSIFTGISADCSGNIFATGYQVGIGTLSYGDSVSISGTSVSNNAIILKYDSSGNVKWARTVTANSGQSLFSDVAVDSSGNIYASGFQYGTIPYTYSEGISASGTYSYANSVLIQYNNSGIAQWAKTVVAGTGTSVFHSVEIDNSGNVYAAGSQFGIGTYTYGPGVNLIGSSEDDNVALVCYNTSGSAQWARTVIEGGRGPSYFSDITIDSSGSVFAAGSQSGFETYTYSPGVTATGCNSGDNAILVKYIE